jgi:hypothetical protein
MKILTYRVSLKTEVAKPQLSSVIHLTKRIQDCFTVSSCAHNWIVSDCRQIYNKSWNITKNVWVILFQHLPGFSFSGVYKHAKLTTSLVASNLLDGHTFQDNRTPSLSSFCWMYSWKVPITKDKTNAYYIIKKLFSNCFEGVND